MMLTGISGMARKSYIFAVAIIMLCAPFFAYWALNRQLPTRFLGLKSAEQDGRVVLLIQSVDRVRFCDTEATLRYIESPLGARLYLQPVSLSRLQMKKIEADTPGEVRLLITVPIAKLAPAGDWEYHIELEYRCDPVSRVWPIRDAYSFKFPVQQ